jgi:hypothetical protein
MNGPFSPKEPIFPVEPLTPEILPCSVLMYGSLTTIEPLFPVEP